MLRFSCPVCGKTLWDAGSALRCPEGHNFDKSKKGYVNLLMSAKSSKKRHGDDALMVRSRRAFLDKGYFLPLLDAVCAAAVRHAPGERASLIDAGCGEGYYTAGVKNALIENERLVCALGVDISRDALSEAHRRDASLNLAVAGISRLPVPDGECDVLLNIFAPHFPEEFVRVLSPHGIVIRVIPLKRHLFGLKSKVYDEPYENSVPSAELPPLRLIETQEVKYTLTLDNTADITALFMMTPYYYKTSAADQAKLLSAEKLQTEFQFGIWVYGK